MYVDAEKHKNGKHPSAQTQLGIDVGSSLTKVALRTIRGKTQFRLLPRGANDLLQETLAIAQPSVVGLTGGGAAKLARLLGNGAVEVCEFAAWGAGANRLLTPGADDQCFLLVSLGTGTSVMAVEGTKVRRLGGTALGGGTVLGLGRALCQTNDFVQTCKLASKGQRHSVDLLVRDIYSDPDSPLNGDLTASAFGRLGREENLTASRQDLAASIMRLVGENVALIAGGIARSAGFQKIVYGGSTLRGNPTLANVLIEISKLQGMQASILKDGEFAGALGALEWAPHQNLETAGAM